jgi:lipopolysaccharide export system permease protein
MLMLVLTGLAWMLQIMTMLKFLISYGINLGGFLGMTVLMVPFIVSIIMPFVAFIAAIFVYNKMISSSEITVMAASGLSPRQIARPALRLGLVLVLIHLVLNIWIVPSTQAKFYDTQWEMRYGLAHLKLQESAFTQMSDGLVVYVDKVSGFDLSQLMLSDTRDKNAEMEIFAEKGKLISTTRGLSIVMTGGSLQSRGENNNLTIGTFDSFDMDMNVADRAGESVFKVRRISTYQLLKTVLAQDSAKEHKQSISEIATRILGPLNTLILVSLCMLILLRASLLRRRASVAPAMAIAAMAGVMAAFMSASNMLASLTDLGLLAMAQIILLIGLLTALFKK